MKTMKTTDFRHFNKHELTALLAHLCNDMEDAAINYRDYYEKSDDKDFDANKHAYASALLTRVNKVKAFVTLKMSNPTKSIISIIEKHGKDIKANPST